MSSKNSNDGNEGEGKEELATPSSKLKNKIQPPNNVLINLSGTIFNAFTCFFKQSVYI